MAKRKEVVFEITEGTAVGELKVRSNAKWEVCVVGLPVDEGRKTKVPLNPGRYHYRFQVGYAELGTTVTLTVKYDGGEPAEKKIEKVVRGREYVVRFRVLEA